MELIKVEKTDTFGVPRIATFYALLRRECEMLENFESEKEAIKERQIVAVRELERELEKMTAPKWEKAEIIKSRQAEPAMFEEAQRAVSKLAPFAEDFLGFMPTEPSSLKEYSLETHFGRGFRTKMRAALPIEINGKRIFAVAPEFNIDYPSLPTMECWAHLNMVRIEDEPNVEYATNMHQVLKEVLEKKYAGCDGISNPKIDPTSGIFTFGSAEHTPQLLKDFILLSRDNQVFLHELARMRQELSRFWMNEDKSLAARALEREYRRGLYSLVHPDANDN